MSVQVAVIGANSWTIEGRDSERSGEAVVTGCEREGGRRIAALSICWVVVTEAVLRSRDLDSHCEHVTEHWVSVAHSGLTS